MAAITDREQEELAARHAVMRDTVAAQAEQLAQAQARIRELEGALRDTLPILNASVALCDNESVEHEDEDAMIARIGALLEGRPATGSFCTPEERAVLDDCKAWRDTEYGLINSAGNGIPIELATLVDSINRMLARRAAKGGGT